VTPAARQKAPGARRGASSSGKSASGAPEVVTPKQRERRDRIEAAAYAVVAEVGYKRASLLTIARRAPASNETLYNWYGNKAGLFRSLIEGNARQANAVLQEALSGATDPLATLERLGPVLLTMVTGERAITLNRAAVGDLGDTDSLGAAIAQWGRDAVAPLLARLLGSAMADGALRCDDPATAADVYIRLLIGDLQVRRMIGIKAPLGDDEVNLRAGQALELFLRLYRA
jgi:AcrR family transcriptional regulator